MRNHPIVVGGRMLTNRPDGHKGESTFTFGGSAAGLSAEDGLIGGRSRVHRLVRLWRPGLLVVVRRDALPGGLDLSRRCPEDSVEPPFLRFLLIACVSRASQTPKALPWATVFRPVGASKAARGRSVEHVAADRAAAPCLIRRSCRGWTPELLVTG